ncbi:putative ribonuclease H superfamily [Helianthus anomalus]
MGSSQSNCECNLNNYIGIVSGTIIDTKVCHPKNNDFYLCVQNGPIVSVI